MPGSDADLNQSLEKAGRVADFLEFADFMSPDALARQESCGCHFNEAFQTEEHEALRDDEIFAMWRSGNTTAKARSRSSTRNRWSLKFVKLAKRSYK